jgi:hypothetical protein
LQLRRACLRAKQLGETCARFTGRDCGEPKAAERAQKDSDELLVLSLKSALFSFRKAHERGVRRCSFTFQIICSI